MDRTIPVYSDKEMVGYAFQGKLDWDDVIEAWHAFWGNRAVGVFTVTGKRKLCAFYRR